MDKSEIDQLIDAVRDIPSMEVKGVSTDWLIMPEEIEEPISAGLWSKLKYRRKEFVDTYYSLHMGTGALKEWDKACEEAFRKYDKKLVTGTKGDAIHSNLENWFYKSEKEGPKPLVPPKKTNSKFNHKKIKK